MNDMETPKPRELPNKPLVEVIFELRWAIEAVKDGLARDPGYQILFGRFYDRMRSRFPELQNLSASQVPEEMTPYVVRHRFRPGESQWPLAQLGPGILVTNETEGYSWSSFRPLIMDAVQVLFDCYPSDIARLRPTRIELKYMDAIPFDSSTRDVLEFLGSELHTRIEVDDNLFDGPKSFDRPRVVNLNLQFPITDPVGQATLALASGTHKDREAVIWQTIVRSSGDDTPESLQDIESWVDTAHKVTERCFFTLCRGKLLEQFEVDNDNNDE